MYYSLSVCAQPLASATHGHAYVLFSLSLSGAPGGLVCVLYYTYRLRSHDVRAMGGCICAGRATQTERGKRKRKHTMASVAIINENKRWNVLPLDIFDCFVTQISHQGKWCQRRNVYARYPWCRQQLEYVEC